MALTNRRQVFIEEYLKCWNGAEAARQAGYKFPRRQASYLLIILEVNNFIEQRLSELQVVNKNQVLTKSVRKKSCFVYLIEAENGLVKIGKTVDVDARFRTLNALSPISLRLLAFIETKFADEMEDELHARFEHLRVRGEWFHLSRVDIIEVCGEWEI